MKVSWSTVTTSRDGRSRAKAKHDPDVAVLDVELPGVDGLTAAGELRRRLPRCRVLIVIGFGRPASVRQAFAGQATGFVVKDTPPVPGHAEGAAPAGLYVGKQGATPTTTSATTPSSTCTTGSSPPLQAS